MINEGTQQIFFLKLAVLISLLFSFLYFAFLFSLKTNHCSFCKSLVTLCCKPNDYNSPIFRKELNIKSEDSLYSVGAIPIYSGKHAIYVNYKSNIFPEMEVKNCAVGGRDLVLVSKSGKVLDYMGNGLSIAVINIEESFSRRELVCILAASSESETSVDVRIVKVSDL